MNARIRALRARQDELTTDGVAGSGLTLAALPGVADGVGVAIGSGDGLGERCGPSLGWLGGAAGSSAG